ncbi:MAG: hypothetical protein AAF330_01990 [Pseudomonadota bacterium]
MATKTVRPATSECDAKGLIRESYRIDGITKEDCRSIFFDWALSLAPDQDSREMIEACLAHYAGEAPEHPMTAVLTEGLTPASRPVRRGGRGGRRS